MFDAAIERGAAVALRAAPSAGRAERAHDRPGCGQGRGRDGAAVEAHWSGQFRRPRRDPLRIWRARDSIEVVEAAIPCRTPRGLPRRAAIRDRAGRAGPRRRSRALPNFGRRLALLALPARRSPSTTSRRSIARCCAAERHFGEMNCVRKSPVGDQRRPPGGRRAIRPRGEPAHFRRAGR